MTKIRLQTVSIKLFTNIGHNLAEQISTDSNLNYGDFLLDKTESRLHLKQLVKTMYLN